MVSPTNVRCWSYPDQRITTGRHQCVHRRCASWPGSILSSWKIPAAVAAGWWSTWQGMVFRSAMIECVTSDAAWGYGRSTRSHELRFQATRQSNSPVWWTSSKSGQWTRYGRPISPTSLCRKASTTWWRSWIFSPETFSAGSCRTALTRNRVCKHWK